MGLELTFISIIAAFIAVLVAINVAYNFYSIHDFQKRLLKMENDLTKANQEILAFRNEKKTYVNIMYQVHNANAKFSFIDKHYFEAIVHELKNIYHITSHKSDFTDFEFREYIGAKYWFIAQDILKYDDDDYVKNQKPEFRNKLIDTRNEIIRLCSLIEKDPNAIDIETKLHVIARVLPTLIDNLYYHRSFNPYGGDWDIIRKLAK